MNNFDKQRIENANWIIQRYRDELEDTNTYVIVNGEYITPNDALKILDLAVYRLINQTED